jgi:hypothetical protein
MTLKKDLVVGSFGIIALRQAPELFSETEEVAAFYHSRTSFEY